MIPARSRKFRPTDTDGEAEAPMCVGMCTGPKDTHTAGFESEFPHCLTVWPQAGWFTPPNAPSLIYKTKTVTATSESG